MPPQTSFVSQSVPRTVAEAYLPFVRKWPFAFPQTWRTDFDAGFGFVFPTAESVRLYVWQPAKFPPVRTITVKVVRRSFSAPSLKIPS